MRRWTIAASLIPQQNRVHHTPILPSLAPPTPLRLLPSPPFLPPNHLERPPPPGTNAGQTGPSQPNGLHSIIENLFQQSSTTQSGITLTHLEVSTLYSLSQAKAKISSTLRTTNSTHLKVINTLESTITALSSQPTTTPGPDGVTTKSWANVTAGYRPTSGPPPAPPSNKAMNEFKLGRFVIQSPPNQIPFANLSAVQIRDKTNATLKELGIGSREKPTTIRGAHKLPSNDVVFYTDTRQDARLLLKNKHLWTNSLDPALPT